jgi:hypothetical protein
MVSLPTGAFVRKVLGRQGIGLDLGSGCSLSSELKAKGLKAKD